jgi:hypothetical protein
VAGTAEDAAAAAAAREQGDETYLQDALDEYRRKPRTNSHNPNDVGRIVQVNRLCKACTLFVHHHCWRVR